MNPPLPVPATRPCGGPGRKFPHIKLGGPLGCAKVPPPNTAINMKLRVEDIINRLEITMTHVLGTPAHAAMAAQSNPVQVFLAEINSRVYHFYYESSINFPRMIITSSNFNINEGSLCLLKK